MTDFSDKRRYPRVLRAFFTAFKRYESDGEIKNADVGHTLNISEGGILLETTRAAPLESRLQLSLGFDEDIIKVEGEIVHLRKNDDNNIEMGIKFLNLSDEDREKIRRSL